MTSYSKRITPRPGVLSVPVPLLICSIILLLTLSNAIAQEDDTDFQTWLDYKAFYQVSERIQFDGDLGIRGVISGEEWTQLFLRPSFVQRNRNWLQLHGGLGLWYTFEQNTSNAFELRPWQGIKILWPKPVSFTFHHFFRLEERMELTPAWAFTIRFRYRIGVKTPNLVFRKLPNNPFFVFIGMEFFMNLNEAIEERYVNRNRFTLRLGNHVAKTWRVEVEFIRQGSRRGTEEGFKTSEYMLRLRIKHDLKSKFFVF